MSAERPDTGEPPGDVPSPIDLRDPGDAQAWADAASARPGRASMFSAFVSELASLPQGNSSVLELGSGPGFLAECLLDALPGLELTLLDFSAPMHSLARARLQRFAAPVHFIERDFSDAGWQRGLGSFAAVITNQSVHELRHTRHAARLHRQVAQVLAAGAPYLVCDHFYGPGGMHNRALFMTAEEHRRTLQDAGFHDVRRIALAGSLVLLRGVRGG